MNIRPINVLQWTNLFSFLNRSWFKRAWVVQEMCLARNVIIAVGVQAFNIDVMMATFVLLREARWSDELGHWGSACVQSNQEEEQTDPSTLGYRNPLALYNSQRVKSWDPRLFEMTQNVRAGFGIESDLRDKVYAFLGISKEFSNLSPRLLNSDNTIVPNYESTCTEVYIDTAKFIINSSGNLDVLSQVQDLSLREQEDLPSWVPDFSALNYPQPIDGAFSLPWNASDGFGPFHVSFVSDGSLEVRGSCFGKVEDSAEFDPKSENMIRQISKFLELLPVPSDIPSPPTTQRLKHFIETAHDIYGSDRHVRLHRIAALSPEGTPARILQQSRVEAFWRTMLLDSFRGQHPAPGFCGETIKFMWQKEINSLQEDIVKGVLKRNSPILTKKGGAIVKEFQHWRQLSNLSQGTFGTWVPCEQEFKQLRTAVDLLQKGQCKMGQLKNAFVKHRDALKGSLEGLNEELEAEIKHLFRSNTSAKNLFVVSTGRLGLGFRSLRQGDELWILCGGSLPILLRPVGPGRYKLVGETCVHGLMHGVAPDSDKSTRVISIV